MTYLHPYFIIIFFRQLMYELQHDTFCAPLSPEETFSKFWYYCPIYFTVVCGWFSCRRERRNMAIWLYGLRISERSFFFGVTLLLLSATSTFLQNIHAVLLVSLAFIFHFQVFINVSTAVIVKENIWSDNLTILLSLALCFDLLECVIAVSITHFAGETSWCIWTRDMVLTTPVCFFDFDQLVLLTLNPKFLSFACNGKFLLERKNIYILSL